jgi:hypothetical protein
MYIPIFEASLDGLGWISGYLGPRLFPEAGQMIQDAKELNGFSPNIQIKIAEVFPTRFASFEGYIGE